MNTKIISIIAASITFVMTAIYEMPVWVMSKLIYKYSQENIKLCNTSGDFWHGGGLLAITHKNQSLTPLLLINWQIKLGIKKFISGELRVGTVHAASFSIDMHGIKLERVNLSLSILQVSELLDFARDMGLSGNLMINADQVSFGRNMNGTINAEFQNISSNLAAVNPIGTYNATINLDSLHIDITSKTNNLIVLNGSGNTHSLILSGHITDHIDELKQFMILIGTTQTDNNYVIKVL